jgi:hypothetical protein
MSEIIAASGGIRTSESIGKLVEALAAAQGEFEEIKKEKEADAGSYTYKYADIADVLAAVRPALSKHGLAFSQPTVIEGGTIFIRTRLMHKSGEWMESEYPVASYANTNHQKIGAALTYARRYAGCSMLGVAAEEDVDAGDGAATAGERRPPQQRRAPDREPPSVITSTGNGAAGKKPLPPTVGKQEPFYLTDRYGEPEADPLSEKAFVNAMAKEMDDCSVKAAFDTLLTHNQKMTARLSEESQNQLMAAVERTNKRFRRDAVEADPNKGEKGLL